MQWGMVASGALRTTVQRLAAGNVLHAQQP